MLKTHSSPVTPNGPSLPTVPHIVTGPRMIPSAEAQNDSFALRHRHIHHDTDESITHSFGANPSSESFPHARTPNSVTPIQPPVVESFSRMDTIEMDISDDKRQEGMMVSRGDYDDGDDRAQLINFDHDGEENGTAVMCEKDGELSHKDCVVELAKTVLPVDMSALIFFGMKSANLMLVGRILGGRDLARYTTGMTIFDISGVTIVTGFSTALDTLMSQEYGRDASSPYLGVLLQRGLAINFILCIPFIIFYIFSRDFMIAVYGDDLGRGAALVLRLTPPLLVAFVINRTIRNMMIATGASYLVTFCNLTALFTCIVSGYYLIGYGLEYAALSMILTISVSATVFCAALAFHPRLKMFRQVSWPTRECLSKEGVKQYLWIGGPSVLSTCAEFWAMDMQQLYAARLGVIDTAIFAITLSFMMLMFSMAIGWSSAASATVGKYVGAKQPVNAKLFAVTALKGSVIFGFVMVLFINSLGHYVVALFTDEEDIKAGVYSLLWTVSLCHIVDSFGYTLQGIFRGAGRQKEYSVPIMVAMWGVTMPLAGLLSLGTGLRVAGIFLALAIGLSISSSIMLFRMRKWDWTAIVQEAVNRQEERVKEAVTTETEKEMDIKV